MIAVLSLTPVRCGTHFIALVRDGAHFRADNATLHMVRPLLLRRSPVNPVTNVFPLVVVLTVSMVKEAAEDNKRRKKDAQASRFQQHCIAVTSMLFRHEVLLLAPLMLPCLRAAGELLALAMTCHVVARARRGSCENVVIRVCKAPDSALSRYTLNRCCPRLARLIAAS